MLLTIYDSNGIVKAEISPNDSSTQSKELQSDNVLSLSFKHYRHIDLDVNDYIDFEGERYWLTEQYKPKQVSSVEWDYNVKLYGIESLIKRFLVLMRADGADEPVFTLTATPREHVAMIVRCINEGMGNISDWKVGCVDGTDKIVVDYHGTYCDEALKQIAEKTGSEWWVEGTTVNVCRCEHGEEIALGYNNGLTSIEIGTADNVKFYTRLFPVGSSRNIDRAHYGSSRLHLPGGTKYVEVNTDKYGIIDHYEEGAFADIYPRRTGEVSSVRSEEKRGDDGNMFTIYYFTDNSLTFDPNDYEIPGLVKRVSFQEGSELAGLGDEEDGTYYFECNYDSRTGEFEIITIWPFDNETQLPGNGLVPKEGDRYIMWNIRMPEEYYGLAEAELAEAVARYNDEHCIDVSVYKCPTDHVWMEESGEELYIGRRVRLESDEYFPGDGYRSSRITKITRNVNLPGKMEVEISDALSEGTMSRIRDDIGEARNYAKTLYESSNLPDIIRSGDRTPATDNNLYSARRSRAEFLSRLADDIAHGRITFEQGVSLMGVNTVDGVLQSPDFVSGLYGGMGIGLDTATGTMELNRIRVREALEVIELLVNRLQAVEGDAVYSESDTIERIEAGEEGTYDLYVKSKWDGYFTAFTAGAVVKGIYNSLVKQVLSGGSGNGTETSASYVTSWMRVNNVYPAQNRINVSIYDADDCPSGVNNAPIEDMVIVRWGHQSDATRQSTICISATDRRITMMQGVDSPKLTKANYGVAIGKAPEFLRAKYPFLRDTDNVVYAKYLFYDSFFQTDFSGTHTITYREHTSWDADTEYWCDRQVTDENAPDFGTWYTDRVWCDGCLWQCTEDGCRTRPKWNNPDWVLLQGRNDLRVEFDVPEGFYDPDNFHAEFNVSVWLGDRNVTSDILPADYEWARVSYDREGNERHQSDAVWTQQFAASSRGGNHVELDYADLSVDSVGGFPSKMVLVCRVTLLDGRTAEQEISIY